MAVLDWRVPRLTLPTRTGVNGYTKVLSLAAKRNHTLLLEYARCGHHGCPEPITLEAA
jgi:hypothetical protein